MTTNNALIALLVGSAVFVTANHASAAEPQGHGVARLAPSLTATGAVALAGHGGVLPAVVVSPTEDAGWLIVEDSLGNRASLRADAGSFWAEAEPAEIAAFLDVVDSELDEVTANYEAALALGLGAGDPEAPSFLSVLDTPLCIGCAGLGSGVVAENAAVVELLEELYIQQLPPIELGYDFTRHLQYDVGDVGDYLGALTTMLDYLVFTQMVEGTYAVETVEHHYVDTVFSIEAGDPRSGDHWREEQWANGDTIQYRIDDDDIDNDGTRNADDWDMDGDGWPNWLDADKDGDGAKNWEDSDPDNPYEQCFPSPHFGFGGVDGHWAPPTPDNYAEQMAIYAEYELAVFLDSETARVLINDYSAGYASLVDTVADLNLAYVQHTAGKELVFASAQLYVP